MGPGVVERLEEMVDAQVIKSFKLGEDSMRHVKNLIELVVAIARRNPRVDLEPGYAISDPGDGDR